MQPSYAEQAELRVRMRKIYHRPHGGDRWCVGPPGQVAHPNDFINDPKLTDKTWYDLQDVSPKLVAAASWDGVPGHRAGTGKQWVIPFMSESFILAYRDDLFQKYNLKVPTTLEDVVSAAKAISEDRKSVV